MKKVTFFTIFISILGFPQEKFTTQDFDLHKNTEKVVSKEFWNDDNENSVFTEEMVFYNTQTRLAYLISPDVSCPMLPFYHLHHILFPHPVPAYSIHDWPGKYQMRYISALGNRRKAMGKAVA